MFYQIVTTIRQVNIANDSRKEFTKRFFIFLNFQNVADNELNI